MADKDAGPSGSGRGTAAAGRGGGRKPKFTPTVPARRKKDAASAEGTVTVAEAAAINEEFKDLIKAAEAGTGWQRGGRGRGRAGPGGRGGPAQHSYQVTFGVGGPGAERAQLAPAKERPQPGSRVKADGDGGGGGGGGGAAGGAAVKAEPGRLRTGTGAEDGDGDDDDALVDDAKKYEDFIEEEKKFDIADALDYMQYYPSTLQPRGTGVNAVKAAEAAAAAAARSGAAGAFAAVDGDVEDVIDAAKQLGLDGSGDDDMQQLFLVQLPNVLPVSAASRIAALSGNGKDAAGAAGSAAGGGGGGPSGKDGAAAGTPGDEARGCPLKELPSGRIGTLLIYASGKVKMRLGDVLMDVSPGLPVQHRMDVAAINCAAGHCVLLGDVAKRMVVSPNMWHLMSDEQPDTRGSPWRADHTPAAANGSKGGKKPAAGMDEVMEEARKASESDDGDALDDGKDDSAEDDGGDDGRDDDDGKDEDGSGSGAAGSD